MKDGEVQVTDSPYVESKESLGGILLLEARDLNHAIALLSKHPALKIGNVFEIRPAHEAMNRLVCVAWRCGARDRAVCCGAGAEDGITLSSSEGSSEVDRVL